jgi:carbamoyltransferase
MNILGFRCWGSDGSHDTSAAMVCDGMLVAAAEQERFSRKKHDDGVPLEAIDFCLKSAGLRMDQVDWIAFPEKPFLIGRDSHTAELDMRLLIHAKQMGATGSRRIINKYAQDLWRWLGLPGFNLFMHANATRAFSALRQRYGKLPPIRFYGHHNAHAAVSHFTSAHDRSLIVTIDGRGGLLCSAVWLAEGCTIRRVWAEPWANSIGFFYWDCTRYLGLGNFGEGKLMGLAAYGNPSVFAKRVSQLLDFPNSHPYRYHTPPTEAILGFPPRKDEFIVCPPYTDFAAACQQTLEQAVAQVTKFAVAETGVRTICLGGGVMLNCSSNGALLSSNVADSIWVFPAAGDGGLAVGAALLGAADAGELKRSGLSDAYLGPAFSNKECKQALGNERRVVYRFTRDLSSEIARLLTAGNVVGWFQGRMEFGPRALGHRSILADPRTVEMRDRVNKIKRRELWRPLAPVVQAEKASEYFALRAPSPFMLFASQVRPDKRREIPAVVHVDGTARPQTVTHEQNPRLYDLISAFARETGTPVLLNTSFNAAGEPLVCTPEDAIRTFLTTDLDVLVLGDYVAWKSTSLGNNLNAIQ